MFLQSDQVSLKYETLMLGEKLNQFLNVFIFYMMYFFTCSKINTNWSISQKGQAF